MPTLEIGGKRVEVGEEFLRLSPEEQQSTVNGIAAQIGVTPPSAEQPRKAVAVTPGEKQFEADKELLAKHAGLAPDALKAFTYSTLNTALLNAPSHVVAFWDKLSSGKDYTKVYEEQKAYEKALERQSPKAALAGTAAGIGAGFVVPSFGLARAAQAAKAATTAKYGTTIGRAAEIGTGAGIAGGMAGTASAIESMEPFSAQTLKDAALGAGFGAAAQAVLPGLSRVLTRMPKVVDDAGNLTPKAQEAIEVAFGKGKFTPEEINAFKDSLVTTMQKKGISPEAAREGLLRSEGVTPTRSMTTGERPLPAAEEVSLMGKAKAEDVVSERVAALRGKPPERTEIAETMAGAVRKAEKKAGKAYEKGKAIPGEFTAQAEAKLLGEDGLFMTNIQRAMTEKGVPQNIDASQGYAKAEQAMNYLKKNLLDLEGKYPYEGGLNAKNIDAITQDLNRFWYAARMDPQDQRAISAIKAGYLRTIKENVVDPAMFEGNGKAVLDGLKKAKKTWKEMKDTFYSTSGTGAKEFNRMMNSFVDQATGRIEANPSQGSLDTAQRIINESLVSPKVGSAFYERMQKAFGKNSDAMNMVNDQIRFLALNTEGNLTKLPQKIDDFLRDSPTVAGKVFTPAERMELKRLSETIKIINGRPIENEQKQSLIAKALSRASSALMGYMVGQARGPLAGAAAFAGSEAAQSVGRGITSTRQKIIESRGAPKFKPTPPLATGKAGGVGARGVEFTEDLERESSYQEPTPLPPLTIRPQRASGGKVSAISDRLIAEAERSKKKICGDTKPLLNADDSHVARALQIANRGLEG